MTPEERKKFEEVPSPHLKYWIPMVWFSNLASKARQEGRIQDNVDLQNILHVTARAPQLRLEHQLEEPGRKRSLAAPPAAAEAKTNVKDTKLRPLLPPSQLPVSIRSGQSGSGPLQASLPASLAAV